MKSHSKLKKENELLKKLATNSGFYTYYFEMLPKCKTFTEAFNMANDKYHELFGQYKYSSYNSFQNAMKKKSK
jgi:hypothetical protein